MKRFIVIFLAALALLVPAMAAHAAYTGPGNRTLSGPDKCDIVLRYCTFTRGRWVWNAEESWSCGNQSQPWNAWPKLSGSCTAAREGQYGWEEERSPGDPITYDPVSTSQSFSCATPGNSGWCRGGLNLNLSASEPIPGYSVRFFETTSGVLCDPEDAASVNCTASITEQGSSSRSYWAVSSFGDTSLQNTFSWSLDSAAPTLMSNASGSVVNGWYTTNVSLNLSGSDATSGVNASTYRYRTNGGAWANGDSLSISTDGIYNIEANVQDVAGNVGARNLTIRLDKTPPTANPTTTSAQQNGWYRSVVETAANSADATSGVALVEHSTNGSDWQPGENVTLATDGSHAISFRVTDNAGHVASRTITIRVDTTAPTVTPAIPVPDGLNGWYISNPVIPLSALDALSGIEPGSTQYRWNSSDWTTGSNVTISQDGIHTIESRANDLAGNTGTAVFAVQVDTTAPEIEISLTSEAPMQNGWFVEPATATAFTTDATSGVSKVEYQVLDAVAATSSARAGRFSILPQAGWVSGSLLTLEDGDHTLAMHASDVAGNITETSRQVRVDTVRPVTTFMPVDGPLSGIVTLRGTSVDATSGVALVEYSLDDGASWQAVAHNNEGWTMEYDTGLRPDGDYAILVRATDLAGNIEAPVTLAFTVNNAPPKVSITKAWWIWESGLLEVKPGVAPLGEIRLEIFCGSLPNVVLQFDEPGKLPDEFAWNRRCGNGTLAAPGKYPVTLTACNIYGKCASQTGIIQIPDGLVTEATPTSTIVPTNHPTSTRPTSTPIAMVLPPAIAPVVKAVVEHAPELLRIPLWLLPLAGLIGSLAALGVNQAHDPRPKAIHRLSAFFKKERQADE